VAVREMEKMVILQAIREPPLRAGGIKNMEILGP
jgi:hypothetical protein